MQDRDSSLRHAAFKLSGDCFVNRLFTSSSCLKEKGVFSSISSANLISLTSYSLELTLN